jgi:hypothetical protein
VNVIMTTSPGGNDNPAAVSNVSHSPPVFIREIGDAYRASHRTKRIFDTVGHNIYGDSSAEEPWKQHLGPWHIAEGDVDQLVQALDTGFLGTAQPVPGACGNPCVSIWYLEAGYQTVPDPAHQAAYFGTENDAQPIPDSGSKQPIQASQLRDGIELAYCQPYVTAFFNFLLWDEPNLARWQSGVLWADGGQKGSYDTLRTVIADVQAHKPDCATIPAAAGLPLGKANAVLDRLAWSSITTFSRFNTVWRFEVEARTNASYTATLYRMEDAFHTTAAVKLRTSGALLAELPRVLQFPIRPLPPGRYRIALTATSAAKPRVTVSQTSPAFAVVK